MVINLRKIAFVLLLFYAPSLYAADTFQLSDKEKGKVESGKLVVHAKSVDGAHIKEVHAFLIIHAPAKVILSVITDYKHLPEFMPNLARVEVLESDNGGALVNYYLDLPFAVHKRYRLQLTYDTMPPNLRMTWQLVDWEGLKSEETIANTTGYWSLQANGDGETLLHYYTKTDPGHVPFGLGWIVDYLTKKTVVELLGNTKEEAEKKWESQQE